MKKLSTLSIIIILMILSAPFSYGASTTTYEVVLTQTMSNDSDENRDEKTTRNHRAPSKPIFCYISESTGIDISAVDKSDITSFEVYSENGICLASLTEESEFISFLFSLSEPIEIRIITDQYIYHGYILM